MKGVIGKCFEELAALTFEDVPFEDLSVLRSTYYCGALTALRIVQHLSSGEYTGEVAARSAEKLFAECDAYFFQLLHGGRNFEP